MDNVSEWIFICPKCGQHTVRLKKLTTWGYQNICESCSWHGILARESFLTEELPDARIKTKTESID